MSGINMPSRPKSNSGSLLSLAGAGAGAALGGPVGAGLGMQAGGMLGGMAAQNQSAGPEAVATGPIQRRMQELNQTPLRQIRDSIDSLKYVQDDAQRAELAKPLLQADYMARMKNGG